MSKPAPATACGKSVWPTKPEAQRALDAIRHHPNQREDKPLRVYRCKQGCGGWHMTSQGTKRKRRWRR